LLWSFGLTLPFDQTTIKQKGDKVKTIQIKSNPIEGGVGPTMNQPFIFDPNAGPRQDAKEWIRQQMGPAAKQIKGRRQLI
jgi:hypothetical protein